MQFLTILIVILQHILNISILILLNLRLNLFLHFSQNFAFTKFFAHTFDPRQILIVFLGSDRIQRILFLALAEQILLIFKSLQCRF